MSVVVDPGRTNPSAMQDQRQGWVFFGLCGLLMKTFKKHFFLFTEDRSCSPVHSFQSLEDRYQPVVPDLFEFTDGMISCLGIGLGCQFIKEFIG